MADSDFLKEPEDDARKLRGNFNGKAGPGEHREAPTDGERQHEDMKRDVDAVVGGIVVSKKIRPSPVGSCDWGLIWKRVSADT